VGNKLQAKPINADPATYFDQEKKLYNPVPVFPFLTEQHVTETVASVIDSEILREEINVLLKKSASSKSTIAGTNYIICLIKWHQYPELVKMLSIIREWAFRSEGGGVGDIDFDAFDLKPEMGQLIILNPDYEDLHGCIVGGYRYIVHDESTYDHGPMGDHFMFSDEWKQQRWIELGRSFINPYIQMRNKRGSIDYVLHGLGYIHARYPKAEGFFGKVTLYNIYEQQKADAFFLAVARNYFSCNEHVYVKPEEAVPEGTLTASQKALLDKGVFKGLFYLLRNEYQLNLVRIMAVYNRMTNLENMLYFGAFRHFAFGNTTEVGIAIKSSDLYDVIKEKFIEPYV
jgi:hypothetical protein